MINRKGRGRRVKPISELAALSSKTSENVTISRNESYISQDSIIHNEIGRQDSEDLRSQTNNSTGNTTREESEKVNERTSNEICSNYSLLELLREEFGLLNSSERESPKMDENKIDDIHTDHRNDEEMEELRDGKIEIYRDQVSDSLLTLSASSEFTNFIRATLNNATSLLRNTKDDENIDKDHGSASQRGSGSKKESKNKNVSGRNVNLRGSKSTSSISKTSSPSSYHGSLSNTIDLPNKKLDGKKRNRKIHLPDSKQKRDISFGYVSVRKYNPRDSATQTVGKQSHCVFESKKKFIYESRKNSPECRDESPLSSKVTGPPGLRKVSTDANGCKSKKRRLRSYRVRGGGTLTAVSDEEVLSLSNGTVKPKGSSILKKSKTLSENKSVKVPCKSTAKKNRNSGGMGVKRLISQTLYRKAEV